MNSNTDETRDDFVSDASQAQGGQASEENAKFILKNDPQTGLHLDEGDSDDCYEISASQEAPEPPTPPKPEIEEPAPGADDVYALAEPEPRPTPDQGIAPKEPGGGVAPASSRAKSKKRAKNVENDEEDDVSVDSLYERRRRALEEEEEQKLIVERDPLPPLPFLTNIFKPFRSAGFLARAGMIAGTIFVPLLIVAYIFTRVLSTNVAGSFAENPDASAWTAYWGSLWAARYFFIPFCFVWGIFAVPLSIQIFVDTASGADEINDWPEFSVVGAIGQFLWIACIGYSRRVPLSHAGRRSVPRHGRLRDDSRPDLLPLVHAGGRTLRARHEGRRVEPQENVQELVRLPRNRVPIPHWNADDLRIPAPRRRLP